MTEKMINNIQDLADWLGTDNPVEFNRQLFRDTACGASISLSFDWREPLHNGSPGWYDVTLDQEGITGFTLQSIVEGSDAEVNGLFVFPVAQSEVDAFVKYMEAEVSALWAEANKAVQP